MLATLAVLFAGPATSCADHLVIGGTEYVGAEIVAMQRGRLRFRQADGKLNEAWVDEVERIQVQHGGAFMDFNQAEILITQGKTAAAIPRYARSLRLVEGFWKNLISIRLVKACDEAGEFSDAVEHFVRVLIESPSGPAAAARIIPQGVPHKRNAKVTRAMARIRAKLRPGADVTEAQRALLQLLRFDILHRTSDDKAGAAAHEVARTSIPVTARSSLAYAIVYRACEVVLKDAPLTAGLGGLDIAIRDCPQESLASFLLLKSETLMQAATTRKDTIRAIWPLMRVAIHLKGDPLAPEALYKSAGALERIGVGVQAINLLRECREHRKVSAKTAALAKVALERLQLNSTD